MFKRLVLLIAFLVVTTPAFGFIWGSGGGSGDIESVGDCTSGAALDGSSDGGETISLYDGDSHKMTFDIPDITSDITFLFPATLGASGAVFVRDSGSGTEWVTTLDVTLGGFTPLRAIISDASGNLEPSDVTSAELALLDDTAVLLKFRSLAVADLSDTATPSVLTVAETTDTCISNYKATGADHVFTMPAAHSAGSVIFQIGDEFQVDIEPNTSDLFYLNGTAMAADEHIQNTADTLADRIVGYCVNINGTLRWMFYSSDTNWVEETP